MSNQHIEENIMGIYSNISTIFENHEKLFWKDSDRLNPPLLLNNESWYSVMDPIELIGKSGRHLRMGTLLSRTSVKNRIESSDGMSFTEFSYQLFQAYDWLYLFNNYGCSFQVNQL